MRVEGLRFGVWGSGSRVQRLGSGVWNTRSALLDASAFAIDLPKVDAFSKLTIKVDCFKANFRVDT